MRSIFLAAFLLLSCAPAFASAYGERLLSNSRSYPLYGVDPASAGFMAEYGFVEFPPDEYAAPEPGGESGGTSYDYRGRLDRVISQLSALERLEELQQVTLGLHCVAVGLYLWRLFILSKSQRNIL